MFMHASETGLVRNMLRTNADYCAESMPVLSQNANNTSFLFGTTYASPLLTTAKEADMKKLGFNLLTMAVIAATAVTVAASTEEIVGPTQAISQKEMVQRFGFIDENGDGINDLARDEDNDGIPNCQDPDWTRPEDGTGYKNRYGYKHQLTNTQNRGGSTHFNYNYNYLWNNNWNTANCTNVCDNTSSNVNQRRNRKPGRRN